VATDLREAGNDMSGRDPRAVARLEELLTRYGVLLRSVIARHCPRDLGIHTADIEQEARVRLWRVLEREKELPEPASYIYRIAVTTTIDAVRRVLARREDQFPDRAEDEPVAHISKMQLVDDVENRPDVRMDRRELMAIMARALATLADDRRRAVELHLQGLTLSEIADLQSWSEARARNLVYRGLDDLRKELRREGIEYP
jgi:RNA polymerase sigma factor (sigma-70 family)